MDSETKQNILKALSGHSNNHLGNYHLCFILHTHLTVPKFCFCLLKVTKVTITRVSAANRAQDIVEEKYLKMFSNNQGVDLVLSE